MQRRTTSILICLLLGAILNVAIAWGCVILCNYQNAAIQWHVVLAQKDPLSILRLDRFGYSVHTLGGQSENDSIPKVEQSQPFILTLDSRPATENDKTFISEPFSKQYILQGWPAFSLWASSPGIKLADIHGAIILPFHTMPATLKTNTFQYALAYRPIWSGFLFNTIFYALILWLLFPGRILLRRRRRIRRGLCGKCGFVVSVNAGLPGASPNCTECGTPIPQGIQRHQRHLDSIDS